MAASPPEEAAIRSPVMLWDAAGIFYRSPQPFARPADPLGPAPAH
jgi:hypothetical protein